VDVLIDAIIKCNTTVSYYKHWKYKI
jgi:hypothetical protein